jgi:hypothetical protein
MSEVQPSEAEISAKPISTFVDMDRFQVSNVDPKPAPELLETFEHLSDDRYLKGNWIFRKRAYARGLLSPAGIEWNSGTDFFQPRAINDFAGDIRRIFEPAGEAIREYVWHTFQSPFYRMGLGRDTYELGLHQIRIVCDEDHEGHPVPEGFHQDGFDVVVIQSYQRQNITGGKSFLREDSKDGPCILERDLQPGEILAFNDRRLFHYADPIQSESSGPGYRDLCVMTFLRVR